MIEGNVIKFGYGTVAVGSDGFLGKLTLREFKPPCEVGERIDDNLIEYTSDVIKIYLTFNDCISIIDQLKDMCVNNKGTKINVGDYVLDFTKFNEKSTQVVESHIGAIMDGIRFVSAC